MLRRCFVVLQGIHRGAGKPETEISMDFISCSLSMLGTRVLYISREQQVNFTERAADLLTTETKRLLEATGSMTS